jgi:hypothetical protein
MHIKITTKMMSWQIIGIATEFFKTKAQLIEYNIYFCYKNNRSSYFIEIEYQRIKIKLINVILLYPYTKSHK